MNFSLVLFRTKLCIHQRLKHIYLRVNTDYTRTSQPAIRPSVVELRCHSYCIHNSDFNIFERPNEIYHTSSIEHICFLFRRFRVWFLVCKSYNILWLFFGYHLEVTFTTVTDQRLRVGVFLNPHYKNTCVIRFYKSNQILNAPSTQQWSRHKHCLGTHLVPKFSHSKKAYQSQHKSFMI